MQVCCSEAIVKKMTLDSLDKNLSSFHHVSESFFSTFFLSRLFKDYLGLSNNSLYSNIESRGDQIRESDSLESQIL